MGLTWSTYSVHGADVLEIAGQLTRMTAVLLEPQLATLLTRPGSVLVIDLAGVDLCDRAGFAMLEACHRAAAVAGVEVRLAAPSAPVGRALRSSGLMHNLPVFSTVDAAARGDVLGRLPSTPPTL
jgi:anti-sigma B factor antagonist